MNVSRVADRRGVAWAMPGSPDPIKLAECCDFARGTDAAHLREMAANEIDQAPAYEIEPFIWIVEQLAHGDGSGALLAQGFEIADIFRRKRIFQEKEPVGFEFLRQADGIDGWQTLVHIVEQFDVVAELLAQIFEELGNFESIFPRLEELTREMTFPDQFGRGGVGGRTQTGAVGCLSFDPDLRADVPCAFTHEAVGGFENRFVGFPGSMAID